MKKKSPKLILAFLSLFVTVISIGQIPSFPGGGGGGAGSVGGRGGFVYEVTNLNDAGIGSLRAGCVMSGARTIVFRVSGTIELASGIEILNPYLTIAGQTAPGGGIQISGKNSGDNIFWIQTHDVIIRFMRLRHGYNVNSNQSGDPVGVYYENNIIDHCTLMWGADQNTSAWGNYGPLNRVTWSWNIIAEPLSAHPVNFLMGSDTVSNSTNMTDLDAHHNLLANSSHRNPQINIKSFRFVNNIVYNWFNRASYVGGGILADFIGNIYKVGPLLLLAQLAISGHEITTDASKYVNDNCPLGAPSIYVINNKGPFNTNPSNDNWSMVWETGIMDTLSTAYRRIIPMLTLPFPIPIDSTNNLETLLLSTVGASQRLDCLGNWVNNRDSCDIRIINEYNSGSGIVPTTENDVGGFPMIAGGSPCPDTDHDGMPDAWENILGLNPNNSADGNGTNVMMPYTNLEAYLSGLNGSGNAIAETGSGNSVSIFPNPFTETTTIDFSSLQNLGNGKLSFHLFNVFGEIVTTVQNISEKKLTMEKRGLSAGMYFYKVMLNAKQISVGKLIVR